MDGWMDGWMDGDMPCGSWAWTYMHMFAWDEGVGLSPILIQMHKGMSMSNICYNKYHI